MYPGARHFPRRVIFLGIAPLSHILEGNSLDASCPLPLGAAVKGVDAIVVLEVDLVLGVGEHDVAHRGETKHQSAHHGEEEEEHVENAHVRYEVQHRVSLENNNRREAWRK
ncbi:hypothetical protein B0T11DRAFT_268734 [Plectosphaerella cucumerina]|uniref:Uncharacterized protein n=1 Tax=Plectosphaerella cucumerina TaxID=40658 RepID=A0A8K0TQB6_9PEZI|nr:hypothetical protein B0T11DRAFT_268734 [Plectosphaerella cucumerina]